MHTPGVQISLWVLRALIALAFVGMGVNHFRPAAARVMADMIPPSMTRDGILSALNLVYFTGVCEIAGGIGMLVPSLRVAAGIALVVFLAAVFPANARAAAHPDRFGRAAIPFGRRLVAQIVLGALILVAALT